MNQRGKPQSKYDQIPIIVHITKAESGEERSYEDWGSEDQFLDPGSGVLSRYGWEDGNYGCDCNRERFFQRAAGEEESDDPSCGPLGAGQSRRYRMRITSPSGDVLYEDEPAPHGTGAGQDTK